VFNYYRTSATALHTVTTDDIYRCASIVVRQQATVSGRELDYGIIRLDRARRPASRRHRCAPVNAAIANGANVAVIGCGSGIPFKIDAAAACAPTARARSTTSRPPPTPSAATPAPRLRDERLHGGRHPGARRHRLRLKWLVPGRQRLQQHRLSRRGRKLRGHRDLGTVRVHVERPPLRHDTPGTAAARDRHELHLQRQQHQQRHDGTTNKTVTLNAGDTIEVGTCTVTGATATGDTYLLLYSGSTKVTGNDDACGQASYFKYVATAAGSFEIRAGCYSNTSCGGTVALEGDAGNDPAAGHRLLGLVHVQRRNTNSAQASTVNKQVTLTAGQTIKLGTCTVLGASGTGDTYLRLYGARHASGVQRRQLRQLVVLELQGAHRQGRNVRDPRRLLLQHLMQAARWPTPSSSNGPVRRRDAPSQSAYGRPIRGA